MAGPLAGLRLIELASLGAAPFCGMVLADLGAEVIKVDRVSGEDPPISPRYDLLARNKKSIAVDLKTPAGVEVALRLVETAEAIIEGFRPGVTERLGLGPAQCLARNPALVYGRMTGWGQTGRYAHMAGHDIDYTALSGVLAAVGTKERPLPPLNLVGDFGGGGMLLALGMLAAVLEARESKEGQVVDAAMVDGSALLMTLQHGLAGAGSWEDRREHNLLDGGAPFYTTYQTADGGHMAVGAIEPQFFSDLLDGLGITPGELPHQHDRVGWPRIREVLAARFRERTREEWTRVFEGSDACVAPVLTMAEATRHPHNQERQTFVEINGVHQPGPAPRFSRTPAENPSAPVTVGADTDTILETAGFGRAEISRLRRAGTVA